MTQQRMFKAPRADKKPLSSVSASHDTNNLRSAKEILECPDKWGGEGSGMVEWAHAVVKRLDPNTHRPHAL